MTQHIARIGRLVMLLSAFACTSTPDDAGPTRSDAGAAAASGGGAADRGEAGRTAGTAGKGAAGSAGSKSNSSSAGQGGAKGGAADSGGPSSGPAGHDAGTDDSDAAVSCEGEIVADRTRCLQDNAFCYVLPDGRYCTGPSAGKPCGARAGDTCKVDEYCAYRPGQLCGQADAQATCQKRPSSCGSPNSPVCGCDQRTYPSTCEANAAGVGVFTDMACK